MVVLKRKHLVSLVLIVSVLALVLVTFVSLRHQVPKNKRDPGADAEGFLIKLPGNMEIVKSGVGPFLIERIPKKFQTTTDANTLLYHVQAAVWHGQVLIVKAKEDDNYDFLKSGVSGEGYALINLHTGKRVWAHQLASLHRQYPETRRIRVKSLDHYHWRNPSKQLPKSEDNRVITSRVFTNMVTSH